jgi:hypothetical protein
VPSLVFSKALRACGHYVSTYAVSRLLLLGIAARPLELLLAHTNKTSYRISFLRSPVVVAYALFSLVSAPVSNGSQQTLHKLL